MYQQQQQQQQQQGYGHRPPAPPVPPIPYQQVGTPFAPGTQSPVQYQGPQDYRFGPSASTNFSNQNTSWSHPPGSNQAPQSWTSFASQPSQAPPLPAVLPLSAPHSAPPQSEQVSSPVYNPNAYGPMPGSRTEQRLPPPLPPRVPSKVQPAQNPSPVFPPGTIPTSSSVAGAVSLPQSGPPKQPGFQQASPIWSQNAPPPPGSNFQGPQNTFGGFNSQGGYASNAPSGPSFNSGGPPPPLPQAPNSSYFSPPGQAGYGVPGSPATTNTFSPTSAGSQTAQGSVMTPDEAHPAYIPPSLSGQGVAAYMPTNTNPLPGVYVPPPPDIPAWTQRQHEPLAPPVKKFTYTKPEVHPSFQNPSQATHLGGQPGMPQPYQGTAYPPMQQHTMQHPPPIQQNQLSVSNQQPSAPPGTGNWSSQVSVSQPPYGQPQLAQQSGQTPFQQMGTESVNQSYHQPSQSQSTTMFQPNNQADQSGYQSTQGPLPTSSFNGEQQSLSQPPRMQPLGYSQSNFNIDQPAQQGPLGEKPHHHPSISSAQSDYPVSPVQSRQRISLSQAIEQSERKHNERQSVPVVTKPVTPPIQAASPLKPEISKPTRSEKATGASALGFGGPSDWEHYGPAAEDEVDDGVASKTRPDQVQATARASDRVELPSQPSPPPPPTREQSQSSAVSVISEDWPTPPAPAPLNIRRPESGFQYRIPPSQERIVGTSDVRSSTPRQRGVQPGAVDASGTQGVTVSPQRINDRTFTPPITGSPIPWSTSGSDDYRRAPQQMPSTSLPPDPPAPVSVSPTPAGTFIMDDGVPIVQPAQPAQPAQQSGPGHMSLDDRQGEIHHPSEGGANFMIQDDGWQSRVQQHKRPHEQPESHQDAAADLAGLKLEPSSSTSKRADVIEGVSIYQADERVNPIQASTGVDQTTEATSRALKTESFGSDLDPWYKESLDRYLTMLRQEAGATQVEDKVKVFTDFVAAESSVRGIDLKLVFAPEQNDKSQTKEKQESRASQTEEQPRQAFLEADLGGLQSKSTTRATPNSHVFEDANLEEYSPGGRPIIKRPPRAAQRVPTIDAPTSNRDEKKSSPATSPPAVTKPLDTVSPKSVHAAPTSAKSVETTSTPGYKPYKSNVASVSGSEPSPKSAVMTPSSSPGVDGRAVPAQQQHPEEQKIYKPFAPGNQTTSVSDSNYDRRRMSSVVTTSGRKEHAETFIDNISGSASKRNSQLTGSPDGPTPMRPPHGSTPPRASDPPDPLKRLSELLPSAVEKNVTSHPLLQHIEDQASHFTLDFGRIETILKDWEASAAKTRARLTEERNRRQEESEKHTDELFNSNEIGYSDIGTLENQFREAEQRRKAQEEMEEYKSYEENVFNPTYNSVQDEIRQLVDLYVECVSLFRNSATGTAALQHDPTKPSMLPTMELLLSLDHRIEARHQRVAKTVADRDRRYKRTAVQPLYAAGKIAEMKAMERHFEGAEKSAALRAAQERVERTRHVMELVDECVVRAVSESQGSIDTVLRLIGEVKESGMPARRDSDAEGGKRDKEAATEILERAKEVIRELTSNMAALLRRYQDVETDFGDAEYQADLAQAKLDDTGPEAIKKLENAKKAADAKLKAELDKKILAIEQDYLEARDQVDEIT